MQITHTKLLFCCLSAFCNILSYTGTHTGTYTECHFGVYVLSTESAVFMAYFFMCITLCRRIGGRYSRKFGNRRFLLYLCSWNPRDCHQTIHIVRFIHVIITWFLWNQSQLPGTLKAVFFSEGSSAGSVWVSV